MIVIKHAVIVQLFFFFYFFQSRIPLDARYSIFGQMSIKLLPGQIKFDIFLQRFPSYIF